MKEKEIIYVKTKHFNKNDVGGSISHTIGIISGFSHLSEKFTVFSDVAIPNLRIEPKVLNTLGLHGNVIEELVSSRKYYRSVLRCLKNREVKYIYHRHVMMGDVGVRAKKKYGIPLVIEFNSSEYDKWNDNLLSVQTKKGILAIIYNLYGKWAKWYARKWEPKLLRQADMIVVVSEPLKERLLKMNIEPKRILIQPNGVDSEVFVYSNNDRENVRNKYGFSKEQIVIGFAGMFSTYHGIPELTKAIHKLSHESNIGWFLVGDGVGKKEMELSLKGISDAVFTGRVPFNQMPAYLSACDILVAPINWNEKAGGRFFGSPTKIFEYMSMGKAIVASNIEQLGHVLEHERTALLFPAGDVEAFVSTLKRAIESKPLRETLGKNARKEAIDKYTWEEITRAINRHFEEIIGMEGGDDTEIY